MPRFISFILILGLVSLMWMSLVPGPAHGQIAFAPPRGANAISQTMPAPVRSASQGPTPVTETTAETTPLNRRQTLRKTRAVAIELTSAHYGAAPTPYSSMLYPAYLRSLNLLGEESETSFSREAERSAENATTRSALPTVGSWPPKVADPIQVASYRVGRQR